MRQHVSSKRGMLTALIAGAVVALWASVSFAGSPSLGPDCGAGASLVGDDSAGKVTMGSDGSTCTLTFSAPMTNPPACTATNETNNGQLAQAIGAKSTNATLELDSQWLWKAGDVISYICVEY